MSAPPRKGEKILDNEDGVYIEDGDKAEPRIVAYNEGGYNSTEVSVLDVLKWVRERRPDLLEPEAPSTPDIRERFEAASGKQYARCPACGLMAAIDDERRFVPHVTREAMRCNGEGYEAPKP